MNDLPVLHSGLLATVPGVKHAFFSRQGGVSKGLTKASMSAVAQATTQATCSRTAAASPPGSGRLRTP